MSNFNLDRLILNSSVEKTATGRFLNVSEIFKLADAHLEFIIKREKYIIVKL